MIIRGRGNKPAKWPMKLFGYTVFEPAHFIMERKMLLRIKELAERSVNAQQPGVATPPVEDRILAS
jgi:hypothetical protein